MDEWINVNTLLEVLVEPRLNQRALFRKNERNNPEVDSFLCVLNRLEDAAYQRKQEEIKKDEWNIIASLWHMHNT